MPEYVALDSAVQDHDMPERLLIRSPGEAFCPLIRGRACHVLHQVDSDYARSPAEFFFK
jgi:hypothetical protein